MTVTSTKRRISVEIFHTELRAQDVPSREDLAFICPICRTVQSARDLIEAGAGTTFEAVETFLGFSCVGRFTGAGAARAKPDGKPCDWTLGGMLKLHQLEIEYDDKVRPCFELASPSVAQSHAAKVSAIEA